MEKWRIKRQVTITFPRTYKMQADLMLRQFLEDTQAGTHKEKEYGSDVGEILFSE